MDFSLFSKAPDETVQWKYVEEARLEKRRERREKAPAARHHQRHERGGGAPLMSLTTAPPCVKNFP
jgi:hypothetical protein